MHYVFALGSSNQTMALHVRLQLQLAMNRIYNEIYYQ